MPAPRPPAPRPAVPAVVPAPAPAPEPPPPPPAAAPRPARRLGSPPPVLIANAPDDPGPQSRTQAQLREGDFRKFAVE
jgi:hypothetical protein